jgi:hypothetical protein
VTGSSTHTVNIVVFPQQWLRERVTILRYTYIAYVVFDVLNALITKREIFLKGQEVPLDLEDET